MSMRRSIALHIAWVTLAVVSLSPPAFAQPRGVDDVSDQGIRRWDASLDASAWIALPDEVEASRVPRCLTVWTLYNARYTTVRGSVLTVPHRKGPSYRDAWSGVALEPDVDGGRATLSLELEPQGLGCIVQE